jgi:hypothetical protein
VVDKLYQVVDKNAKAVDKFYQAVDKKTEVVDKFYQAVDKQRMKLINRTLISKTKVETALKDGLYPFNNNAKLSRLLHYNALPVLHKKIAF